MNANGFGGYAVVVPIRSLRTAKSRLQTESDVMRAQLALAFFLDTITALERSTEVERIVVVSRDATVQGWVRGRCDIVPDGEIGLPAAIDRGIERLRRLRHSGSVAVVLPDLPYATTDAFDLLLASARGRLRAFLADVAGTGTTCVTAASTEAVVHRFGPNSARAHTEAGLAALDVPVPNLRNDIDVLDDLRQRHAQSPGNATKKILDRWRVPV
ncbi:2-phospho-L-lactate guanylyltransferase [Rhodococcus sp. T2V]|uniref:2-phospho-L-lactate guanylyltransferase n=1 Tax=Rhodococcus sp. T2V TaxID=3034164 RepID=UPI0023E0D49E|nr:2-phospho-L-lactate guanylyltransferase [Rhodococcus sp. T2V]MDF3307920.1 2-phospho-L-lactate guanylyltransferase [Rhodococcus sp. T2V]